MRTLGRQIFQQCAACHSLAPGVNGLGPSLAGVIGRKAGSLSGFRFSNAIKRSGITWDEASLARFIQEPQQLIPGNRMPFSGVEDAAQAQALLEYLRQPDQ
ncbi:c-type cytochrome [Herbaspirillum lusitanum]|uniref:C-type cytochrome n=1 Tax=Herbaspirillum lusitanum TaxID=213312 RepID=A0ABW9AFW8_9BURK